MLVELYKGDSTRNQESITCYVIPRAHNLATTKVIDNIQALEQRNLTLIACQRRLTQKNDGDAMLHTFGREISKL